MKKRKWMLVAAVSLVVVVAAFALYCRAWEEKKESGQVVYAEDSDRIIKNFAEEIAYVEGKCGMDIPSINTESLEVIKEIAYANLENENFRFRDLMTCLAYACSEFSPWWERPLEPCPVCGH